MKLLDYIRGLRKGKEANRLEKESMKDPFLADAMDGYHLVDGDHELQIGKLRMRINALTAKKKKTRAAAWSIAACLAISFGISGYFLFLKKEIADDMFIAKKDIVDTVTNVSDPKSETALPTARNTNQDSAETITAKQINQKDIIARTPQIPKSDHIQSESDVAAKISIPDPDYSATKMEEVSEAIHDNEKSLKKEKSEYSNVPAIKGVVRDKSGEPIVGAVVKYKGKETMTITGVDGRFSLKKEKDQSELTAHFMGYDSVNIPIDSDKTMLITMKENENMLSDVVIVAHSENKKTSKTSASSSLSQRADSKSPQPIVGQREYQKYLKKNIIHPSDEECKNIKGEVILTFNIDSTGTPQHITVTKSLCKSADKEAIRLIQEGPKWTTGSQTVEVKVKF